ncbi:MAG: hypothetical protein HC773_19250 [Scytonema sp. CRU_2_7]|nr:hypothetical protein [Scytonema sp. CRU_2_7]
MELNNEQKKWLEKIQHQVMAFIYRKDLRKLATLYGTNKWNQHWYAQHYNKHFTPLRLKK